MVWVSIVGLLFLLTFTWLYSGIKFSNSFLITSMLSVTTYVGVVNSFGFIVFLIAVVNFFIWEVKKIEKKKVTLLLSYCFILLPIIFISLLNGAKLEQNILKYFQIVILFFFLLVILDEVKGIGDKKKIKFVKVFLFINLIFGLFSHIFFNAYDLGFIRFSGIFFDANYFGLHCLLMFYIIDTIAVKNHHFLKVFIIIFLLLSFSLSAYFLFLMYIIFKKYLPIAFLKAKSFFIISSLSLVSYLFIMTFLETLAGRHIDNDIVAFKLISLMQRLNAQFQAIDMIKLDFRFLEGFGSGRNLELTGKALHNSFLQMIFSHGIFFYFISLLILTFAIRKVSKCGGLDNKKYYALAYSYLISTYVLDPIIALTFHLFLLFSIKKKSIPSILTIRSLKI